MREIRFDTLDASSPALLEASVTLIVNAFGDPERYCAERVARELQGGDKLFYRQFFIAVEGGRPCTRHTPASGRCRGRRRRRPRRAWVPHPAGR